jgi:hypothetical protein
MWARLLGRRREEPSSTSREVTWLLRRLGALTPGEWQTLVAAHAGAGRAGPAPFDDLSVRSAAVGVRAFDATHEASMIAIRAVGDEAADGWREAMVVTSLSRMGREVPANAMKFSDADRERLYYHAWSYMSPAEWASGYLAVRGTFTDAEWSAFWQPYRSVLGEPPPT